MTRGAAVCSGLSSPALDQVIAALALRAVEPAALELSLRVSEEIEHERHQSESLWQKRLQRARYEAERAERQYRAVEPENRLVVDHQQPVRGGIPSLERSTRACAGMTASTTAAMMSFEHIGASFVS